MAIKNPPQKNWRQRNILLSGQETLPAKSIPLRAGDLSMIFEPDNAFLRYIRFDGKEVVRNIYAAVRDQNWNTIPWSVRRLKTNIRRRAFDISFNVDCEHGEIRYTWRGAVSGDERGRVTFSFEGEAKSKFLRNRIGICVLHPIFELAGKACCVEHSDGKCEETEFPKRIAPWQPLHDVRAVQFDVVLGASIELRFEGDTFETED
jgi:D-apionolactonase